MSRTDKDRPYWVIENEGTLTDHRHERFGQPITAYTYARDENGKKILIIEPVYLTARTIVQRLMWSKHSFSPEVVAEAQAAMLSPYNRVYSTSATSIYTIRAMQRAYDPDKLIFIRYREYYKRESKIVGYVKDYCTEGEKTKDGKYWFRQDLPCTPDLAKTAPSRKIYTKGLSKRRAGYSKVRNGGNRVIARDTLKGVTKSYNAGVEVDDFDESRNLTAQHRHSLAWDLY
jgi:hypothetical protein